MPILDVSENNNVNMCNLLLLCLITLLQTHIIIYEYL